MIQKISFGIQNLEGTKYPPATGSCSLRWLTGLRGEYDYTTHTYKNLKLDMPPYGDWNAPIMCLATDNQEREGVAKTLREEGFIKLGGCRSAHGEYNCNLWIKEPREGKKDNYNPAEAYHFYANPNVYKEGAEKGEEGGEIARLQDELATLTKERDRLQGKLMASEEKVTQLKAHKAEQRLLRKKTASTGKAKAGRLALRTGTRRTNGVRMGRVNLP